MNQSKEIIIIGANNIGESLMGEIVKEHSQAMVKTIDEIKEQGQSIVFKMHRIETYDPTFYVDKGSKFHK